MLVGEFMRSCGILEGYDADASIAANRFRGSSRASVRAFVAFYCLCQKKKKMPVSAGFSVVALLLAVRKDSAAICRVWQENCLVSEVQKELKGIQSCRRIQTSSA